MSVHRRLPTLRRPGRWPVPLIIVIVIAGAVLIAMAQGSLTLGPRDGSSPQSVPDDHMLPPAAVAPPASISLPDSSRVVASTKDETLQEVAVVPARVWFAPSGKAVLADAVVLVKFLRTRPSDRFGVWVLDASGAQLGVVETSFSPMAIWRSSTQELLVSESFEGFQARLVALDLTNHAEVADGHARPD